VTEKVRKRGEIKMITRKTIRDKKSDNKSLVLKPINRPQASSSNKIFRDFLLPSSKVFTFVFMSILILTTLILTPTQAQENQGKYLVEKLLVYVDPSICPAEILEKNIPFATFVSDPSEANVIVEVSQAVKDRQVCYQIKFRGKNQLSGKDYLSELNVLPNLDLDQLHTELARVIKLGLVPYAGWTPEAGRLKIRLEQDVKPTAVVDPWNFWVFSLSANSFLNGEKSYSFNNIYGNFSANRVTPDWKIRLSVGGSYSRNVFNYEGLSYKSTSSGGSFRALIAKSLGEHWSIGTFINLTSSTYQNIKISGMVSPAVEYNFFPYSESTKRQLRLTYSLDVGPAYYREETIFNKTREFLVRNNLSIALELKRKWGTISSSIEGSHYYHDFSKYRIEFNNDISVRLFRGFSFNVYGGYARIRDLISIARAGASWEDVLLMRKQLATSYDYYFSVGISYSWGSIFSNVVNPRFGSGSSGFSIGINH